MNSLCQYHGECMDKCVKKTWTLRVNVREYSFSFNVQVIDSHLLQKLSIAFFIYMVPVCILNNVQQNVHFMHVSVFFLEVIHYSNFDLWNITLCNKGSVQHLNHCWENTFFSNKSDIQVFKCETIENKNVLNLTRIMSKSPVKFVNLAFGNCYPVLVGQ